jgi:hypothetical protein
MTDHLYLKYAFMYLCIIEGFDFEQGVGSPSFVLRARLSDHESLPTKGNDPLQFIIDVFLPCALFLFTHNGIVRAENINLHSKYVHR